MIKTLLLLAGAIVLLPLAQAEERFSELTGSLSAETRWFPQDPLYPAQESGVNTSVAGELEYYTAWNNNYDSITFSPFFRLDNHDSERTHADIRELYWLTVKDDWELRVGINKVFWGVTESVHLVDIINQTDLIENTDGEDKLGQPMVNFTWIADSGNWQLYMLPGFRERTFPGLDGRLRTEPVVDTDNPRFEADNGRGHIDWAARWSHYFGNWDIGLAHFYGTSREPTLVPSLDGNGNPIFTPYYPLIHQTSLDAQLTTAAWLWKLEWITRDGQGDRYTAAAGGFEYTLVGIMDSAADLGLIGEYLFDDRGDRATTLFQDDLMVGARLTLNDVQSSELLFGIIQDLDNRQRLYSLEASRRLGDRWKLALESRFNTNIDATHPFGSIRNDDYVQLELTRYF